MFRNSNCDYFKTILQGVHLNPDLQSLVFLHAAQVRASYKGVIKSMVLYESVTVAVIMFLMNMIHHEMNLHFLPAYQQNTGCYFSWEIFN